MPLFDTISSWIGSGSGRPVDAEMPIVQEGPLYDEKGAGQYPAPSRAQNDYFLKLPFRPALSASYQRGLASLGSFGVTRKAFPASGRGAVRAPGGFALSNPHFSNLLQQLFFSGRV
jgi:hypothetical protein